VAELEGQVTEAEGRAESLSSELTGAQETIGERDITISDLQG
jgi:hypothetical protein